jgi:hypothetical protein
MRLRFFSVGGGSALLRSLQPARGATASIENQNFCDGSGDLVGGSAVRLTRRQEEQRARRRKQGRGENAAMR